MTKEKLYQIYYWPVDKPQARLLFNRKLPKAAAVRWVVAYTDAGQGEYEYKIMEAK